MNNITSMHWNNFLIKTYGFSEHDAKVKVMQDFDEVKEDFETKEIK